LPWEFIDTGIDSSFLAEESRKANGGDKTVDCLEGCAECGLECRESGQERYGTGHRSQVTDEKEQVGRGEQIELADHRPPGTMTEMEEGSGTLRHDTGGQAREGENIQETSLKKAEGKRFTFRYTKLSDARYIGHIDTMNIILRALRASGIVINMHRKYHPMPKIVLSDALPIGIESTCELIEIEVAKDIAVGQGTLEAINRNMPEGMKMQEFIEGPLKDMVKEYLHILVSETDMDHEFEKWKQKSGKYFYIWRDGRIKDVWMRGVFRRIIKIEARKIYGI
jgi:hypothetical protein